MKSIIKDNVHYIKDGNIIHFIFSDEERPQWSKILNTYLTDTHINLNMEHKYLNLKNIIANDDKLKRFVDFVSHVSGVKVDLASGPSGYLFPLLETLAQDDIFIATDACPAVISAYSDACNKSNFYIFDVDLDREIPFKNESINIFCGRLLNNVINYPALICEVYRALKPGGKFAVIEMFFEQNSKTYEYLKSQGAIWSSFEVFVEYCKSVGFTYLDSDIIHTRKGKITDGDLYPLDDNDVSTDRTVYFEKPNR